MTSRFLSGQPIRAFIPRGSSDVRRLVSEGFQAFTGARLSEACRIFEEKMLDPANNTLIGLTLAGAMTPAGLGGCLIALMERGLIDFVISTGANLYHDLHLALNFTMRRGRPDLDDRVLFEEEIIRIYDVLFPADVLLDTDRYVREFLESGEVKGPVASAELHYRLGEYVRKTHPGCEAHSFVAAAAAQGVPIYTSSPGDSSIGMNVAYHALMNDGDVAVDHNRDVNEVAAIILAGNKNGCLVVGGGSPKNFYLQGQPTLWEIYGIQKGGTDFFIQLTTDQVVWGGLSGATPSEAVSWGKINPGVLADTVVVNADSTLAFPILCEYVLGGERAQRPRRELVYRRDELLADLRAQANRLA